MVNERLNIITVMQEIVSSLTCKENIGHYCPNCDRSLFNTLQLAQKVLTFIQEEQEKYESTKTK